MALNVRCPKGHVYMQADITIGDIRGCPQCWLEKKAEEHEAEIQGRILEERRKCAERARQVLMLNSQNPHWPDLAYDAVMNPERRISILPEVPKVPKVKKYHRRPTTIEATQWFKNGDHPQDNCELIRVVDGIEVTPFLSGGKVVRRFRHPQVSGTRVCLHCGFFMDVHGWIDEKTGGHIVCPGDWVITGLETLEGWRYYPCHADEFERTYETEK